MLTFRHICCWRQARKTRRRGRCGVEKIKGQKKKPPVLILTPSGLRPSPQHHKSSYSRHLLRLRLVDLPAHHRPPPIPSPKSSFGSRTPPAAPPPTPRPGRGEVTPPRGTPRRNTRVGERDQTSICISRKNPPSGKLCLPPPPPPPRTGRGRGCSAAAAAATAKGLLCCHPPMP
jgi:hypothetical protein